MQGRNGLSSVLCSFTWVSSTFIRGNWMFFFYSERSKAGKDIDGKRLWTTNHEECKRVLLTYNRACCCVLPAQWPILCFHFAFNDSKQILKKIAIALTTHRADNNRVYSGKNSGETTICVTLNVKFTRLTNIVCKLTRFA